MYSSLLSSICKLLRDTISRFLLYSYSYSSLKVIISVFELLINRFDSKFVLTSWSIILLQKTGSINGFLHLYILISCQRSSSRAIRNVKFDPLRHLLLTLMSPSNIYTIFFEMCRPRPIPLVFTLIVYSMKPKSLNSFFQSLFFIPIPLSMTYTSIIPKRDCLNSSKKFLSGKVKSFSYFISLQITFTVPFLDVNLRALEYKLSSTCCILYLSDLIMNPSSQTSLKLRKST